MEKISDEKILAGRLAILQEVLAEELKRFEVKPDPKTKN